MVSQHRFRSCMAWCRQATSHYLNQCWPRSPTPCGITRPHWFNPYRTPKTHHISPSRASYGLFLIFFRKCIVPQQDCGIFLIFLEFALLPLGSIHTWTHDEFCSWWRHQMESFSALLIICAGNSPVPGEIPAQGPVTRSFDVFFDLRLNKRLSKQSWGWWFEPLSRPFWRHCNVFSN